MKEGSKIYKLLDLVEDIKKVNAMIVLHSEHAEDTFMLEQYKSKRDKLMSYLIDELVKPEMRSAKSFSIIVKLLEHQYPNLKKEARKDTNHSYLKQLEVEL